MTKLKIASFTSSAAVRLAGDHFPRSIEFLCSYRADTCDSSSTQWKMLATTNKKFVIERGPPSHETRPGVSSAQMSHLSSIKSLPRPNHRIIIHFACSLNRMSSTRTSWLCISFKLHSSSAQLIYDFSIILQIYYFPPESSQALSSSFLYLGHRWWCCWNSKGTHCPFQDGCCL